MSSCNFTNIIPSNQCIGDSLKTINSNFLSLDTAICNTPRIIETDEDIYFTPVSDGLGYPKIKSTTASTPIYSKQFESLNSVVSLTSMMLTDGFSTSVYKFPYVISPFDVKPMATFDCISQANGTPYLTLLWSCSSSLKNIETVYSTNSSASFLMPGNITPNDHVTTMFQDQDTLYIGGSFTKIGEIECNKMAIIDLSGGASTSLGYTGSLISTPVNFGGDLGEEGEVTFIQKASIVTEIRTMDLLIIAGSFKSANRGRGLTIWDNGILTTYPFYVNGVVHDCILVNDSLYIVGYFDFINYGNSPQPLNSGQRIYTKSIAKINLKVLATSQNEKAIDVSFCEEVSQIFSSSSEIFSIVYHSNQLFIGGDFQSERSGVLYHKNLMSVNLNGQELSTWNIIVDKPVRTLMIDDPLSHLYVGGDFTRISTQRDTYNDLSLPLSDETIFNRAAAFDLSIPIAPVITDWKPKFNRSVKKFAKHNSLNDGFIYAMGNFTELNDSYIEHIAALTKATDVIDGNQVGKLVNWSVYLPTSPPTVTHALLRDSRENSRSVFIGGTFTRLNKEQRFYFARVTGVGESIDIYSRQELYWDIGMKIVSGNENYSFDFDQTPTTRAKAPIGNPNAIQKTTIKLNYKDFSAISKGQLCRFFVKRPGRVNSYNELSVSDDTFRESVYVHGWYLQFK